MILKKTLVDFDNVVVFGFCNILSASFLLPLGYQRVNTNSIGGTIGKNLKKITITFQKKRVTYGFTLWNFYSSFGTPKAARKIGQSVTLVKVSPANCHSGQSVQAKVCLAKVSFFPFKECGISLWFLLPFFIDTLEIL